MADTLISPLGPISRDSKVLVNVDHASEELLVVSFPYKTKIFQGILIDSTNRYLPCGYPSQEVVRWSPPRKDQVFEPSPSPAQDTNRAFYSLSNRFTYFQDVLFQKNVALAKSAKQAKAKAQKMTVRLRPRQVLCSKCRSICNENSENVHSATDSKKEKSDNNSNNIKNLLTENSSNENLDVKSPRKLRTTLVPKLSRLEPDDIRELNGGRSEGRSWSDMLEADKQMVLRKKRSVGSMEDLWDETVFEEAAKKAKTTPIIKISFGSPGEGTVLKIPSKVQLSESEGEEETKDTPDTKALKKAMKKAKKEAKRKISPERDQEPTSPCEINYKKHRHRVKHKKRHKSSKEEEMKDKCLKQKLSINLKRVSGGPGEEAWSGESTRSSELVKDSQETKQRDSYSLNQSYQQIISGSRLNCEQDCKENLLDEPSPSKSSPSLKIPRTAQKRRKLATLESLLKNKEAECEKQWLTERLGIAILKNEDNANESSEGNSSKLNDNTDSAFPFTGADLVSNDSTIRLPSDYPPDIAGYCSETVRKSPKNIECVNNESTLCDASMEVEYENNFNNETKDIPESKEAIDQKLEHSSDIKLHSDNFQSVENYMLNDIPNVSKKNEPSDRNDAMEESSEAGYSLLELEQTAEEILSESDKDVLDQGETSNLAVPSPLESTHDVSCSGSSYSEQAASKSSALFADYHHQTSEKESDNFELSEHKLNKSFIKYKIEEPSLSDELKSDESVAKLFPPKNVSEESYLSELNEGKLTGSPVEECTESEVVDLPQNCDDFHSISTKMECSEDRCTTSDEPLDSSEDSEFLLAEDGPFCPPEPEGSQLDVPGKDSNSYLQEGEDLECSPPSLDSAPSESVQGCAPTEDLDSIPPLLDPAPSDIINPSLSNLDFPKANLDCPPSLERLDRIFPDLEVKLESNLPKDRQDCTIDSFNSAPPNLDCAFSESSGLCSLTMERQDIPPPKLDSILPEGSSDSTKGSTMADSPPNLDCPPCLDSQNISSQENALDSSLAVHSLDIAPSLVKSDCAIPRDTTDCVIPKIDLGCSPPNLNYITSEEKPGCASHSDNNSPEKNPAKDIVRCASPEETFDVVPNFPASSPLEAQDITSCQNEDGSVLTVGDIVWAKVHGLPWWPAKVVRLSASGSTEGGCDARVAWFGSATCTLMSAEQLSPFIQTFKAKYNRDRKSSGYQEAIRQATTEASSRDFHQPQPIAEINKLLAL